MDFGDFLLGAVAYKVLTDGEKARRREAKEIERMVRKSRKSMTPEERARIDAAVSEEEAMIHGIVFLIGVVCVIGMWIYLESFIAGVIVGLLCFFLLVTTLSMLAPLLILILALPVALVMCVVKPICKSKTARSLAKSASAGCRKGVEYLLRADQSLRRTASAGCRKGVEYLEKAVEYLNYEKRLFAFCRSRTCLDFISGEDIWSRVERWAKEYGYKLESQSGMGRVYKSGFWNFSLYRTYLLIHQEVDKVHAEVWKKVAEQEVAADDGVLLFHMPSENRDLIHINKLLTTLESSTKIREACKPRACLDFIADKEIWGDAERWAKEYGYKLKRQSGMEKVYKRGVWNFTCLLIRQNDDKVHLESWRKEFARRETATDEADMLRKKPGKTMRIRSAGCWRCWEGVR
ncbi:MAG: hypothetical protein LBI31_07315 [Zoogloeaceae bacterium]|jgi:hypothetical protein|nr:hypothetical protein [Zoogloeaceae bacterium]